MENDKVDKNNHKIFDFLENNTFGHPLAVYKI